MILKKTPALFVGHGSPMNAIETNSYTKEWVRIAKKIGKPKGILSVSAHWYTDHTSVFDTKSPKTVYDMYGFPEDLYSIVYDAPGDPTLAKHVVNILGDFVGVDNSWGLDHGTWSVLHHMYPDKDVPVVQLSIDKNKPFSYHYLLGKKLQRLREEGILIFGTGNIVHNLHLVRMDAEGGYPWAYEFDDYIEAQIKNKNYEGVLKYKKAGKSAEDAFWTPDHYLPLLYVLGASDEDDEVEVFNKDWVFGSVSMTGYLFSR
jgi:4,5-DOPA dioxygenase extradiol